MKYSDIIRRGDFTKADIFNYFVDKVVRPYAIYCIVRENYEHKNFTQGLWEIWQTIGYLFFICDKLSEEAQWRAIDDVSDRIVVQYWDYIESLVHEICQENIGHEAVENYLNKFKELKIMGHIDQSALEALRKLEESIC